MLQFKHALVALTALGLSACIGAVGSSATESDGTGDDGAPDQSRGGSRGSSTGGAGGTGSDSTGGNSAPGAECGLHTQRLVRLTPLQLENTLKAVSPKAQGVATALAPFAPTTRSASSLDLTVPHVEALLNALDGVSSDVVASKRTLATCLDAAAPSDECVQDAIKALISKAFRRPASSAETTTYLEFYRAEKALDGAAVALQQVTNAILLSQKAIFRSELGDGVKAGVVELTPFEKADFLAFTLSNAPPDSQLRAAAEKGDLGSAAGLRRESERLMAKSATSSALATYFDDLVGTGRVMSAPKSGMYFPKFNNDVRADMLAEFRAFVEHVVWNGDGRLETMLTAPYTFLNQRLGQFYGLAGGADEKTWKQVNAPDQGRAGLLTLGAFLVPHGLEHDTDIIRRGLFVREKLLCDELPAPPGDVNTFPPPPDGANTNRERLAAHSQEKTCAVCHRMMDPIGFALENFDSTGVYRAMDPQAKKPIDASGYLLEEGKEVTFTGAQQMAKAVLMQPRAHECFARRLESFVVGQGLDEGGHCKVDAGFVDALSRDGIRAGLAQRFANPMFWKRAVVM